MTEKGLILLFVFSLLSTGCQPDRISPVEVSVAELISNSGVPGVSIAVIKDFKIDYLEVHGVRDNNTCEPVTQETLFQAASISKSLTSMCALKCSMDKKISLDENINTRLLCWQVPENNFTVYEKVTLRHLLGHTAGTTVSAFPGYCFVDPIPTLIQVLYGMPPANTDPVVVDTEPGSSFRYSGGGYCIVQQALIDIEQKYFPQIMRATVFLPLNMTHSTCEQPPPLDWLHFTSSGHTSSGNTVAGNFYIYPEMAAAGLWTTPEDLALFLIEIQLSLKGESNKVLNAEFTELMMTNELVSNYGLGLSITTKLGEIYFGHGGGNQGFRCLMMAHINYGVGAVVMTNSDDGYHLAEDIIYHIGTEENWPGYIQWQK